MSLLRPGRRRLTKNTYPSKEGVFLVGGFRWIVRVKIYKSKSAYYTSIAQFKTKEEATDFFNKYKQGNGK